MFWVSNYVCDHISQHGPSDHGLKIYIYKKKSQPVHITSVCGFLRNAFCKILDNSPSVNQAWAKLKECVPFIF